MSDIAIDKRIDALPDSGITITALKALDFIVPGEWVNDTDFNAMITRLTGQSDRATVKRIRKRAVSLYNSPDEGYQKAVKIFGLVDTVDKVVAATAMASKVGQSFSFLSFLDKLTPKADTTQAIDAGLKLVAEVMAFFFMRGIPKENIGDFVKGLAEYGKADLMRLASWVVIDGLVPLGPDFMSKIITNVEGMGNNKLFDSLSGYLPGNNAEEKKNFITKALSSSSAWISGFVEEKGLTQDLVVSKIKGVVNVADSGLDYLAAALDASTDYFSHTGTQTVGREVITRAWAEVQAEMLLESTETSAYSDDDDEYAAENTAVNYSAPNKKRRIGAFMHAVCLAAMADGELSDEEAEVLFAAVSSLPGIHDKPRKKVEKKLSKCIDRIDDKGFDAVMAQVVSSLPDYGDRYQAFVLAASVQYADGTVTSEEDDFLYDFATQLGISAEDAQEALADLENSIAEEEWGDDDWGDDDDW